MPAQKLNLKGEYRIEKGASFEFVITATDSEGALYSLVGASCAAQLRETVDATASIAFTCVVDEALSTITLTLTNAQTSSIPYESGVWQCELTESDGFVTRLYEGSTYCSKEGVR